MYCISELYLLSTSDFQSGTLRSIPCKIISEILQGCPNILVPNHSQKSRSTAIFGGCGSGGSGLILVINIVTWLQYFISPYCQDQLMDDVTECFAKTSYVKHCFLFCLVACFEAPVAPGTNRHFFCLMLQALNMHVGKMHCVLTLVLVVANLANTKWCKKTRKWLKPWHMGTHLRVLSKSYPMNTNMSGFKFI